MKSFIAILVFTFCLSGFVFVSDIFAADEPVSATAVGGNKSQENYPELKKLLEERKKVNEEIRNKTIEHEKDKIEFGKKAKDAQMKMREDCQKLDPKKRKPCFIKIKDYNTNMNKERDLKVLKFNSEIKTLHEKQNAIQRKITELRFSKKDE